jgi:hypothetical protein
MADKLNLPKANTKITLTAGKVEPAMKAAEATSTKLYRVPVSAIKPIPGFNVRVESPDYIAHRDMLRASIANGYDQAKPLTGYVADEDGKNVIYVTDGYTRLAAVLEHNADEATAEEDEINVLPVIIRSPAPSLADLNVALHTGNSGRALTPFELGIVVKRLLAEEGATKKTVAASLAITTRYLDDVLLLANADGKVKQAVASGAVSSTLAIGLLRKDPESAAEKIEAAVSKAASTGKKATKKLTGVKMKKIKATIQVSEDGDMKEIVKAAAKAIREAVPNAASEEDDDVLLASVEGTVTIIVEVPAPEKPAKKAKATKKAKAEKPAKKAKAEPEAEPAKKGKKAKAEPEAEPAKKGKKGKGKKGGDDLGIEGAEAISEDGEDDEIITKMPPKDTKSDPDVPNPDEDVDI